MKKRVLSLLMSFILLVNLLPATARAAENNETTVTVDFTAQAYNSFLCAPQFHAEVGSGLAESYGYADSVVDGVSALDVLVKAHEVIFGEDFTAETKEDFLKVNGGFIYKIFAAETGSCGYTINGETPHDGILKDDSYAPGGKSYTGYLINQAPVVNGDALEFFVYQDSYAMDYYPVFQLNDGNTFWVFDDAGSDLSLTINGYWIGWYGCVPMDALEEADQIEALSDVQLAWVGATGALTDIEGAVTNENGEVTLALPSTAGIYYLTAYMPEEKIANYAYPVILPLQKVTVLSHEDYARLEYERIVAAAKDGLTWEQLSAEPQDAVTTDFTLPNTLDVDGKTVSVGWQSSNAALGIGNGYAWVDRPAAEDASVRLTASLVYETAQDTKVFPLTVKAEGVNDAKESVVGFKPLMDGIAAAQTSSADAWMVLDMAGYGQDIRTADYAAERGDALTSSSPNVLARFALAEMACGGNADELLAKLDESNVFEFITYIPYALLAYERGESDNANITACINALLAAELPAGGWNYGFGTAADVDATAMILSGLAPYYKTNAEVKAAVDRAVTVLSETQAAETGAWNGNANSTAMAVVSLAALGIDAHRDSRFIKDGHSAVEGLMSFALSDKTGFGYKGNVTENALATEQGLRALVSYARFAESGGEPYNIYLQAKAGEDAPADPKITTTVKPQPVTPTDKSISVSVRVSGDTGVWLSTRVSVRSGVSVYDVLTSVLADNGYSWEGSSNYISYITNPDGVRLGEFSTGDNSGWLYKVNGVLPSEPLGEYIMESNASIVFYYTNDWTKDPDAGKWSSNQTTDSKAADKVDALIDAIGTVTPERADAIRAARAAYDALSAEQKKLVENYDALLAAEKALAALQSGGLPFTDIKSGAWYADAVKYAYEKGLMNGVSTAAFAPDGTATRSQIVTILYRLAGSSAVSGGSFADVNAGEWYADAVAWASANGIVTGYDNGSFGPDDEITREQLAVILYRYAKRQGQGFTGLWYFPLSFSDAAAVSSWADEAMHWCVMKGILSGTDQSMLEPGATATRAQIAAILQRFCELPQEDSKSEAERAFDGAASYLTAAVPAPRYGSIGGEWTVIALSRAGAAVKEDYFTDYEAALEQTVRESAGVLSERKYTEYSRAILALSALGKDARDIAGYDLTLALGDYEKTTAQGVNGAIYALLALDSREYPVPQNADAKTQATRQMYIDAILAAQLSDGSWSFTGESADPDLTAMALQALAKYQGQSAVKAAVNRALVCLSTMQNADGGFSSWGTENAESCAQVILALAELGISVDDTRFVKDGGSVLDALLSYQNADGGFCHTHGGETNLMASEQAACALASLVRAENGETGFYRMAALAERAAA